MTRHEQLVENYENALFELLMEGIIEHEGEKVEKECEQLKNNPEFSVPPEMDRRCLKAIDRACRKKRYRQLGRKTYKALSTAAVVVLTVLVLFTSAYAAFPSVRAGVLNLLMEVSDAATTLRLGDTRSDDLDSEGEISLGNYTYGGIPYGFMLESSGETSRAWRHYYTDGDDSYIDITANKGQNAELDVNTEDAEYVKEIEINTFDGLLIGRGSETIMTMADDEFNAFITITSNCLDETGLFEIAETIEYVE